MIFTRSANEHKRQRVGMDEPLSNLDAKLREQMPIELVRLRPEHGLCLGEEPGSAT